MGYRLLDCLHLVLLVHRLVAGRDNEQIGFGLVHIHRFEIVLGDVVSRLGARMH